MSVRTYDPRPQEIYPTALCSAGCKKPYHSICRLCNLAYCFEHLKLSPHACDTKREFIVLTPEEVHELYGTGEQDVFSSMVDHGHQGENADLSVGRALPEDWDPSPKGCWDRHPKSGEICQLLPDGHTLHMRAHPNGQELECWTSGNGKK